MSVENAFQVWIPQKVTSREHPPFHYFRCFIATSTAITVMITWLHFSKSDYLLFQTWRPSSDGAIISANIAIFAFGILERGLAAWRRSQEHRWRTRARTLILKTRSVLPSSSTVSPTAGSKLEGSGKGETEMPATNNPPCELRNVIRATPRRVPPLIPSHDIPRGIVHAVQSAFSYILMLIVMTFNAGYIISVILGLGVGEVIFGRIERLYDASMTA
ncbi:Ctr copper transporter family-domain-containing protein [Scleroderma yunnanense]